MQCKIKLKLVLLMIQAVEVEKFASILMPSLLHILINPKQWQGSKFY
jgi:hypothetical protein